MDQFDIPTGARWDDEIEKALQKCEIFLLIMTPASIASENAKDEVGYAIDHGKFILPVLLKDCTIPLRLRRMQYVDFRDKSFDEGLTSAKELLSKLENEVEKTTATAENPDGEKTLQTLSPTGTNEPKTVPSHNTTARHQAPYNPVRKGKRTKTLVRMGVGIIILGLLLVVGFTIKPLLFVSTSAPTQPPIIIYPTQTSLPTSTLEPTVVSFTQTPTRLRYFTEEFDQSKNWDSDWALQFRHGNSIKQNSFDYWVSDGELRFNLNDEYVWDYFFYNPDFIYNNVELEIRVANLISTDTLGLICQYSELGWYEIDINGGGEYYVRFVDNLDSRIDEPRYELKFGSIPGFKYSTTKTQENTLRIICDGNSLSLNINERDIFTNYSSSMYFLEQGQIGIAVRSYENYPVNFAVKSITVREPQ